MKIHGFDMAARMLPADISQTDWGVPSYITLDIVVHISSLQLYECVWWIAVICAKVSTKYVQYVIEVFDRSSI